MDMWINILICFSSGGGKVKKISLPSFGGKKDGVSWSAEHMQTLNTGTPGTLFLLLLPLYFI